MARPPISEDRKRHAMIQASRRMVARGERPAFRVVFGSGDAWTAQEAPWVTGTAASRSEALAAARAALAAMLKVEPDGFEVTAA